VEQQSVAAEDFLPKSSFDPESMLDEL